MSIFGNRFHILFLSRELEREWMGLERPFIEDCSRSKPWFIVRLSHMPEASQGVSGRAKT